MTEPRKPQVGDRIRILPGATGNARELVGQIVSVSDTSIATDYIRFAKLGGTYGGTLARFEWEFADAPAQAPALVMREGAFYLAESGDVIGPMSKPGTSWHNSDLSGRAYNDDGTPYKTCSVKDPLIREVPDPSAAREPRVGDRVRFTDKVEPGWWFKAGQTGKITEDKGPDAGSAYRYRVWVDGNTKEATRAQVNAEHFVLLDAAAAAPAPEPEEEDEREPDIGDRVRILPGSTGTAKEYIGQVVEISEVDGPDLYFLDDDGEEACLVPGEWEYADGEDPSPRKTVRKPEEGDMIRILPGAAGIPDGWEGRVVEVVEADDDGDPYVSDDDGDRFYLTRGEWEFADDAEAAAPAAPEPAEPPPPAPTPSAPAKRRPVVSDLLKVQPGATGAAEGYIGETVEVIEVDDDGDPYFDDWKDGMGPILLVSSEWTFAEIDR